MLNLLVVDIPMVSSTSPVQNRNQPLSEAGPNFPKTGSTTRFGFFLGGVFGGGLKRGHKLTKIFLGRKNRITPEISPLKRKTSILCFPLGSQLCPVILFAIL